MTTGELEKRRKEKFETFGEWCYSDLGPNNTAECKGAADRLGLLLQEDIDEAKKEFPKVIELDYTLQNKQEILIKGYDLRQLKEWFEKWFGMAHAESK